MSPQEVNPHISTLDTSSPKETQSSVAKANLTVTMANTATTSTASTTSTSEAVANTTFNVNDLAESLKNLKKVIPLMGKYSVPMTLSITLYGTPV